MLLNARVITHRIENLDRLDRFTAPLQRVVSRLVEPRSIRNTLSGTRLGHPLHPALTDIPIGSWLAASVLDVIGGPERAAAADLLIGVGIGAALPTAAAGFNDWSDTYGPETRVGFLHAAGNITALTLYATALVARRTGHGNRGRVLSYAGLVTTMGSAYLGGHLSFVRGVNVNHTAFETRPDDWTDVAADHDVGEGQTVKVDAAGAGVLLHRQAGRLYALASTCSHLGGPLHEGKTGDGCITCPWHGSIFRLDDGRILRGPASTRQPSYETRLANGRIEVRARR